MIGDYFSLAFKNLKHRGLRSWLTLLGIVIGVLVVVSLVFLGNGLKAAVNAQFGVSSIQALTVQAGGLNYGPPGSGVVNPLTEKDAEAIEKLGTVEFVAPRNLENVKLEYNDQLKFGSAIAINQENLKKSYELIGIEVKEGRLLESGDKKKVVLGNNYEYKDKSGFNKEIVPGKDILIQGEEFNVIGILEKEGSFILDNIVIVFNDELQGILGYEDKVDVIGVKVKEPELMDKAKGEIEKLLRERRNVKEGNEDFSVQTPDALIEQVTDILDAIQAFILILASISILVGAIGIVNTMTTSVLERRKEIGIMKAVGATNNQVFFQFFIEAGLMGLMGSLIGIILGSSLGYLGVYFLNSFIGSDAKPVIDFVFLFSVLIGGFLIGSISGIAPAIKASRENPVEALRK